MTTTAVGAIPVPRSARSSHCPYVGLVPFTEDDRTLFFGRTREVRLLAANLSTRRLTLLYAPSGVGKTSLLRAGLLPHLREVDADDEPDDEDARGAGPLVVYLSDWSGSGLDAVVRGVLLSIEDRALNGSVVERLRNPSTPDVAWLAQVLDATGSEALYLVLDQYEEYLHYHRPDGGDGLPALLGQIVRGRELQVNVLLAIREDALAQLDHLKGSVPGLFENYLRLAHLGRRESREAIEGPLAQYNLICAADERMTLEPGLVERLLDQVQVGRLTIGADGDTAEAPEHSAGAPDRHDIEAPFLQLVLVRLWEEERTQHSAVLRVATLDALGGARTVVQTHLDTVMGALKPQERDLAALVLRHLVTSRGSKVALSVADLSDLTDTEPERVVALLEDLSSGTRRILRPLPPSVPSAGPTTYEIFHDVLGGAILAWRRRHLAEMRQEANDRALQAEKNAAEDVRRRLRRARLVVAALAALVLVLVLVGGGFFVHRVTESSQASEEYATTSAISPASSLGPALHVYSLNQSSDTQTAVMRAWSAIRGTIVVGGTSASKVRRPLKTPDGALLAVDRMSQMTVIDPQGNRIGGVRLGALSGDIAPALDPYDSDRFAAVDGRGDAVVGSLTGKSAPFVLGDVPEGTNLLRFLAPSATPLLLATGSGGDVSVVPATNTGESRTLERGALASTPSDDGRSVIIEGSDHRLRAWDATTGALLAQSRDPMPDLPARVDGQLQPFGTGVVLVDLGPRDHIITWDWRTQAQPILHQVQEFRGSLYAISVDQARKRITLAEDQTSRTYDLGNGKLLGQIPNQLVDISDAQSSPDGKWLATAGDDGKVFVWSQYPSGALSADPIYTLQGHVGSVSEVSWGTDSRELSSWGSNDGTVRHWVLPQVQVSSHPQPITGMDVSTDKTAVAAVSGGLLTVSDSGSIETPSAEAPYTNGAHPLVKFVPGRDDELVTVDDSALAPRMWTRKGNALIPGPAFPSITNAVEDLAVGSDGEVVVADNKGYVDRWDAAGHALPPLHRPDAYGSPSFAQYLSVAFDSRSGLLAAGSLDGVTIWRRDPSGQFDDAQSQVLPSPNPMTSVAFDPTASRLVATSSDGTFTVWNMVDGGAKTVQGGQDQLYSVAFGDNGRLVAVGSLDGTIEVWDTATWALVEQDHEHAGSVLAVGFTAADGSRLASAGIDERTVSSSCEACRDPEAALKQIVDPPRN
ncbi:hypothetical protein LQ327_22430 [Actinomycetospora endophytica]|uniref:Novel STAND NTPase 1 domain-containing protein n=1 Tax=Actinomycetospora endophytica TaxID=2291215 RepID=A0ABS8PCX4_9PSEU|nr:hypothetical protein [Actinomycetospora endophytica]MCD2196133.1 hypothetical protein [Actinomycetospora endophytica]